MSDSGKLRFGLVGGGEGSFIGQVHRMAAELDGQAQLVCGAFATDAARSLRSGMQMYHLPAARCYPSYHTMFASEQQLPVAQRMQFVIIAAPNHVHYPAAQAALQAGFHVVCDKPVTLTLVEAQALQKLQTATGLQFAVTYNYTGYPMVREARNLVRSGVLGPLRRISCEYLQGWLSQAQVGNKQATWRTDPSQAGVAGCFGDIGSHAENLLSYVSGLQIQRLCADLTTCVPGRQLDDDGNVLLQFHGGAKGIISASQIAVGKENDLSLQLYGEAGGLEWRQSNANSLIVRWPDKPMEVRRSAGPGTSAFSKQATRLPAGHPEGYLGAFAEIYRHFIQALQTGSTAGGYPSLQDGVRGMQFIEKVVASSAAGGWLDY